MSSTIRVWNGNQYQDHTLENFGKSRIFIGSGSYCDIVIKAQGIEAQHGMLLNNNGEWFYQDSDSITGTFMNGNRVTSQKLAVGNVLVLGEVKGENTVCLEVKSVAAAGADRTTADSQSVFEQAAQGAVSRGTDSAFSQAARSTAGQAADSAFVQPRQNVHSQPSYGQNVQGTPLPTYGQGTQNMYQPSHGQGMQNMSQPTYGQRMQGTQQPSYGQGMQGQPYQPQRPAGQPYQPQRQMGQPYPQQNRPVTPPQNNNGGSGKKTGLIIGIISGVAAIAIAVVILFATGVFGGKKEETGSTVTGKVDNTELILTTEAVTEATTAATEATTEVTEAPTEDPSTEDNTQVPGELDSEEIYKIASPSTVEIQAFNDYYGSQGSGFFDDDKGTVVTNYHVIEGTKTGTIITSDNKKYSITGVLGYDTDLDIAILSTDIGTSVPLVRKTDTVQTGEKVYALGSSQGYSGTFTEGIVSTAERVEDGHVYIQHSAPITNGNSGGPLLDKHGYVMGINNWVRLDGQNLNFAIPIDQVDNVSRTSSMTLAQVYEKENGGYTPSSSNDFGNGKKLVLDSVDGVDLQITVPEYAEVNEATGEAEYVTEADDAYFYVSGTIEEGKAGATLDEMNSEIIEKLEEILNESEEEGVTFEDISSGTLLIDGKYWYVYTTYGYMEDENGEMYLLDAVFFVGQKDNQLGFIQMISVYANNEELEKNYEMISGLEEEMIATIKF